MISTVKRQTWAVAIVVVAAVSTVFNAGATADGGREPFKVGETDLAAGGLPAPEYPNGGGGAFEVHFPQGETDRWAETVVDQRRAAGGDIVARVGFTDMSAGGLPRPDKYGTGPRFVYTEIGETDRSAGIEAFSVSGEGLVIALESNPDTAFVLLRTEPEHNGRNQT